MTRADLDARMMSTLRLRELLVCRVLEINALSYPYERCCEKVGECCLQRYA